MCFLFCFFSLSKYVVVYIKWHLFEMRVAIYGIMHDTKHIVLDMIIKI